MHNVQLLASQVVGQVLAGRNLNQALDEVRRSQPGLTPQQRSALQDMSYSTLRWQRRLSALLDSLLERPLTEERAGCLLLVALGQLEYGKSATHAVVDNAVQAAGKFRQPWIKGLVNAVLRNFLRRREALLEQIDRAPNVRLSYPDWWIAKLQSQYPSCWEAVLDAGNRHPPMTLRVNARRIARDAYFDLLAGREIAASRVGTDGIRLQRPLPVEKLPAFAEGLVSVQDLGAQHAAGLLDLQDGMHVLDACSAPGGKAAHIVELADVRLLALDSDGDRLGRVRSNLQRLGLDAQVRQGDAARVADWWDGGLFDRILADVPCSASGIVRRHPDIKWLRRDSDITGFAAQQANILDGLWSTLAKGGKLLYVTCSVFEEENCNQIKQFLAKNPDACSLPLSGLDAAQLLPCDEHDGFFYALLQKT